jgi:chromosome segregation ATPase
MGEIQKLEANKRNDRDQLAEIAKKLRLLKTDLDRREKALAQKSERVVSAEGSISELEEKIVAANDEVGTELLTALSGGQRKQLRDLEALSKELEKDERKRTKSFERLRTKKNALETILNVNLLKQLEEKRAKLGSAAGGAETADVDERVDKLDQKKSELDAATKAVEDNATGAEELQTTLDAHSADMRKLKKDLEDQKKRFGYKTIIGIPYCNGDSSP